MWSSPRGGRWVDVVSFRMPSLGADMDEGTVVEWLVKPGDSVRKGDVVAVIDTAKAAVEVECFDTGVVRELLVQPGTKVPVGTPLATIDAAGRATEPVPEPHPLVTAPHPEPAEVALASPPARKLAAESGVDLSLIRGSGRRGGVTRADIERVLHATAPVSPPPDTGHRTRISPYARRLAAELGVAVADLTGSGKDGQIRARDVRAAHPGGPVATPPATITPPATTTAPQATAPDTTAKRDGSAMRHAIATLMARSKREIPHYYLTSTIDMSAAMSWLHDHNRAVAVSDRLLPAALLLKASAVAAARVPAINGFWIDDHFQPADTVHLGVAIALHGGGLVAPAILDAAALPVIEIMRRLRDLVSRTRSGRLRSSEMTAATITVTNLGDLGVESVHGVIYPPQVALVGFGAVHQRPWAVDGLLGVRPLVTATLAADHRASDGATGAGFLNTVEHLLRRPEEL